MKINNLKMILEIEKQKTHFHEFIGCQTIPLADHHPGSIPVRPAPLWICPRSTSLKGISFKPQTGTIICLS